MDVLNGCGHQCDTCLADAALPSRQFSFASLEQLFSNNRFLKMLQPDSLRFGSSGDILDHPQGVEIVEMAIEKTHGLNELRLRREDRTHLIKVFTNYRPNLETQLNRLLNLTKRYPDRLVLYVSLPLNRTDTVNDKFSKFAVVQKDFFRKDSFGWHGLGNLRVIDVRHPQVLAEQGRMLAPEVMRAKNLAHHLSDIKFVNFKYRGLVKTYFNPDALWLMIYATAFESYTNRTFTPITPENINVLSQLPYHPDFPTPPHWTGGKGQIYLKNENTRKPGTEMLVSEKRLNKLRIIR